MPLSLVHLVPFELDRHMFDPEQAHRIVDVLEDVLLPLRLANVESMLLPRWPPARFAYSPEKSCPRARTSSFSSNNDLALLSPFQ